MNEVVVPTIKRKMIRVNKISDDYFIPTHHTYVPCFDKSFLKYVAEQLKELLKYKWSCEVIITGERRSGKSNLAQQIARIIDPNFPQENVVFRINEFIERFHSNPVGDVEKNIYPQIILDEAGYDLFSQQWYDRVQKEMIKLYEVSAAKYTVIYLIAPSIGLINSQFKNFGHFWIELNTEELERGIGEFWRIKRNKFTPQPYYDPKAAFLFESVEDDFWREYEIRKKKFINEAITKIRKEPEQEKLNERIKILIKRLNKYETQADIARLLGLESQGHISRLIKDAPDASSTS